MKPRSRDVNREIVETALKKIQGSEEFAAVRAAYDELSSVFDKLDNDQVFCLVMLAQTIIEHRKIERKHRADRRRVSHTN